VPVTAAIAEAATSATRTVRINAQRPIAVTPPSPAVTPRPTTPPTSGRYALLRPCPDQPDCWIYRTRSGDNLYSIARYFGVPLKTIQAWNPWTANGLKAGRDLRIPPPTR